MQIFSRTKFLNFLPEGWEWEINVNPTVNSLEGKWGKEIEGMDIVVQNINLQLIPLFSLEPPNFTVVGVPKYRVSLV